ncbi:MAG: hypothetical protein IJ821_00660 [Lachnospiraceae bacterium]|nr:hypothetical protein [Lachnospiraceae bacterium]
MKQKDSELADEFNEQGEETVEAGEHFLPIRTDNSSFVDCRLDDGRLVRLKITKTDYPVQIDGVNVMICLKVLYMPDNKL